jgi:hypothetical protein
MAPEDLKLAAIAFAVLSVICLGWAASEWGKLRAESPAGPSERSARRGGLILLVASLLLLSVLWGLAGPFGWSRDRALWAGLGTFLAVMTATRPWWFWENYKARWLRELIGDEPTALLYLLLAGVMVWVGLFTDWSFGRR